MRKIFLTIFVSLLAASAANSQDAEAKPTQPKTITIAEANNKPAAPAKRGPVFRPTKDQIKQAQAFLKDNSLYSGEAAGTYNDETREAIRSYQKANGLKVTGTLNRVTLEKMNIALTENQKAIPVKEGSGSTSAKAGDTEAKPKKAPVFRATKNQIMEAQRMLKEGSMYGGDETGKLDDATREGLRKYQAANGLKVTGTLNRITLEKMGITLTDAQRSAGEGQ